MSEARELYQEIILDHNKKPRNFFKLEKADLTAEGYNPICGDRISVYLQMDGDHISNITFQGSGCAISKASASLMTSSIKGKSKEEAEDLVGKFRKLIMGEAPGDDLGKLTVFEGVSEFPARVKCASLAWHTLQAALEKKRETVSTE